MRVLTGYKHPPPLAPLKKRANVHVAWLAKWVRVGAWVVYDVGKMCEASIEWGLLAKIYNPITFYGMALSPSVACTFSTSHDAYICCSYYMVRIHFAHCVHTRTTPGHIRDHIVCKYIYVYIGI